MDISSALRAAAEDKIGRLSRFRDGLLRAEVHFSEERNPRITAKEVCEVTMEGGGEKVRCKVAAADPFAAIDLAVEKLEQQLHKLKIKQVLRTHQGPRRSAMAAGAEGLELEDDAID
jgi:ribosomal subunit interface protein